MANFKQSLKIIFNLKEGLLGKLKSKSSEFMLEVIK